MQRHLAVATLRSVGDRITGPPKKARRLVLCLGAAIAKKLDLSPDQVIQIKEIAEDVQLSFIDLIDEFELEFKEAASECCDEVHAALSSEQRDHLFELIPEFPTSDSSRNWLRSYRRR